VATSTALITVEPRGDDGVRKQPTIANGRRLKAAPTTPTPRGNAAVDGAWGSTVPRNLLRRM
jgi:hypothetical protein